MSEASLSGCPSDDDLVRLVEGGRGDASLAWIEAHVDRCERCAAVIAGLEALGRSGGAPARGGPAGTTGAVADSHERTRPRRELEAAATVSAAELPPSLGSGPHGGARSGSAPRSAPGSRPDSGPRPASGAHSDPASRNITVPRSPSGARWSAEPGAPAPPAPRRRIAPIAIAGVAAAAGVGAVLLGARALSRKPARPPAAAGSATAEGSAPAPAPGPGELRVEPIAPGSAAPTAEGGSGEAARPGGVPLDPPAHAPGARTVATAPGPATGPYADLSSFVTDVQKAIRLHDARTCKRLIAGLPGNVHPTSRFYIDSSAAYCDMIAGDCPGGTARLTRVLTAQGQAAQPAMFADQYCPIEGPLEARLERLRTQIAAHTMGAAMDTAWCDALVPPAKQAAGEAATGPQRGIAAFALHQLAKCVGSAGRCDEARALWSLSNTVDEGSKLQKPDLGPTCAAASAALAAAETYVDPAALLQTLTAAIRQRDVPGCKKLIAAPIPNVHPGQKYSIELSLGQCEMLSGDCKAGTARLARIGPNASGRPIDPSIRSAWLDSNVSMYCAIAGDLDTRVARLYAQMDAFTTRDSGLIAWCDAIIPPARTIAAEVSTPAHRKRTAFVLQRLATCVARVGRCDQGRELWTLSTQVDPAAPAAPALGARCP